MKQPFFSIIMPTWNRAYVMWKAINSVIDQTFDNWELIIIDDGSTDDTDRFLEEFRDPRIRILRQNHKGACAARNYGLCEAKAEHIAYLDTDNTWSSNFLQTFYDSIEDDPAKVFWYCGSHATFYERKDDGKWEIIFTSNQPRQEYTLEFAFSHIAPDTPDTNCLVHKKNLIEQVGSWDVNCGPYDDWDLFIRIYSSHPDGLRWIPKILVKYRQVHGANPDGICARSQEEPNISIKDRNYLLEKWGKHPKFNLHKLIEPSVENLKPFRAGERVDQELFNQKDEVPTSVEYDNLEADPKLTHQ